MKIRKFKEHMYCHEVLIVTDKRFKDNDIDFTVYANYIKPTYKRYKVIVYQNKKDKSIYAVYGFGYPKLNRLTYKGFYVQSKHKQFLDFLSDVIKDKIGYRLKYKPLERHTISCRFIDKNWDTVLSGKYFKDFDTKEWDQINQSMKSKYKVRNFQRWLNPLCKLVDELYEKEGERERAVMILKYLPKLTKLFNEQLEAK